MTDFIIRGRAGGKTTEILERMRGDERIVMVCATNLTAEIHRRAALRPLPEPAYAGIEPWRFIPATNSAVEGLLGRGEVALAFDNVEMILAGIFRHPVDSISGTDASYT